MFIVHIASFLFLCLFISWHYKEKLIAVLPFCTGILILVLYMLAFFQKLCIIDFISIGVVLCGFISLIRKKAMQDYFRNALCSPSSGVMYIIFLVIYVCVKNRMIRDWDELGVWGVEVKSLYFINGFADRYKYVAIEYADYFPGQMLFEWWTCHFSPSVFKEGLAYVGYYWLYAAFLMPVLKYIDLRRKAIIPTGIVMAALFLLLPGIAGTFGYKFLSAELLISVAFAYCLFQYIDLYKHYTRFAVVNLTLCTMQLMLFKETGILYAILALFLACIILKIKKRDSFSENGVPVGYRSIVIISSISSVPAIIWKIYCKILQRGKYFDNTAKSLVNDLNNHEYKLDQNTVSYIKSFILAFIKEPLHEEKTYFIDMTVIMCIVLIIYLLFYAYKKEYFTGREYQTICVFYLISIVVSCIALLCMHIFIFREEQYLVTANMIKSISRYLEPLFLGFIIFIFYFLIYSETDRVNQKRNIVLCASIILLCANYGMAYDSVINYKLKNDVTRSIREETLQHYANFFEDREKINHEDCSKFLYVEPVNDLGYNRVFRFLVAPDSLVLLQLPDDLEPDGFRKITEYQIVYNHCDYIFFDGFEAEYLSTAFGQGACCTENVLMTANTNENGDIVFYCANE